MTFANLEASPWWVMASGRSILIRDMTDSHLTNAIEILRRMAPARLEHDLQQLIECSVMVRGDAAADAVCVEMNTLMDENPLNYLGRTSIQYLELLQEAVNRELSVGDYLDEIYVCDDEDIPF